LNIQVLKHWIHNLQEFSKKTNSSSFFYS